MIQQSLFHQGITAINTNWRPAPPPPLRAWGVKNLKLDTETTGLRWYANDKVVGISYCLPDGSTGYLPFAHRGGGNLPEGVVDRWVKEELRDIHLEFFNAPFDINSIFATFGVDLEEQGCTVGDVGLSAALLNDHRRDSALEDLAQEYLGEGKIKGLDKTRMADYHAGDVAEYACRDVLIVHQLKDKFRPLLEAEGLTAVNKLEEECIYATCEMERAGIPINEEKLHLWLRQSEKDYIQVLYELHKICGFIVNPRSVPDLKKVFLKFNLPYPRDDEPKGDDYGKISFKMRFIEYIDHPAVRLIRRAKRLSNLRSKYLIPYAQSLKDFGKLISSFHQLRVSDDDGLGESGTVSGRYSSSSYKGVDGVNSQQVSGKKYQHSVREEQTWPGGWHYYPKELCIPKEGLWCSADADQIEYRIFSHYAKPPSILAEYERDPHTNFHKVVHKMFLDYTEITYETTKDCNFAGLFGAGVDKFAWMLRMHMTNETGTHATPEGKKLYRLYHSIIPEAKRLYKQAIAVAEERGYVKTLMGRRARFKPGQWAGAAINRAVQGTAADEMKLKLVLLRKERKYTGLKLRLTVHDETGGDVPDAEAAKRVSEVLNRQILPTIVPLLWTVGIGSDWNNAKKVA